jgi:hypothetical protein
VVLTEIETLTAAMSTGHEGADPLCSKDRGSSRRIEITAASPRMRHPIL